MRARPRWLQALATALVLVLAVGLVAMAGFRPWAPQATDPAVAAVEGRSGIPAPSAGSAVPGASPMPSGAATTIPSLSPIPSSSPDSQEPPYQLIEYEIQDLAPDELPYVGNTRLPKTSNSTQDKNGIPIQVRDGNRYYGPAALAQWAIDYEDAYRRSGDDDYLAIATKVERKLMALGHRSNGGVYIPYEFDFRMHGIATEVMKAPWYSAMAQGLALSLAVRLHRDTRDARFLADARLLFATFRHVGRGDDPWITYIDAERHLWLEEYPQNLSPSDHAANGFNFAVFGLYDYYQETREPVALQILRASLTTMRHAIADFRQPGGWSLYCLRHGKPQRKYHGIVTWQLEVLERISGDPYFGTMARIFARDDD